ncbi:MAG: glycosyltransferase family 4 protein [Scytonematopsis contorta HA4267-MV1]|jgi:glycosyltransferase involved in cell wall biosynthesis|nr:glycosyltransferase family 4 protein [Scytonematopsis contorta HA4267-MV1]
MILSDLWRKFRSQVFTNNLIAEKKNQSFSNQALNLSSGSEISESISTQNTKASLEQVIKLSVITQFFPPDYAATGQLIEELTRQLGILGVDVEVFTGQPGYAFQTSVAPPIEQLGRVRIQRSRATQIWSKKIRGKALSGVMFLMRTVLHILRNRQRSNLLLITTAPPFLPVIGYLAHIFFRMPYVCILYDLYPDIAVDLGVISKHHWLVKFWQSLNRRVWRNAKGLIVLSPEMKERVATICPQVDHKITVIHSWGDPKAILPIPKAENWFASQHNLVDKFTVLYSGNMGRCHDMDTILDAAKLLQDEPIQFVFIGSGAKRKQVMEEAQRLGLDNFIFLPYQEKHTLPYSLTACDLSLVSVDVRFESLVAPSKLYPALAAGRPVAIICSKYSYLTKLMQEGDCGGTFENGDAEGLAEFIRLLSRDQLLAEWMGKSARNYMQNNFTPEIISQQYLKVLHQAIYSPTE